MVDRRAVSSVVGVVLIVGLTLAAITAILGAGTIVLNDAQDDAHMSQMENAMSQMASKSSLVALDESPGHRFDLGAIGKGQVTVEPNAGSVKLYHEVNNSTTDILEERNFGAVIYRNGDEEIAFQGGGVWKKYETGSTMLSPPEYHYKGHTLTFPIVRVVGNQGFAGSSRGFVTKNSQPDLIHPNPDTDPPLTNPLEEGAVFVEIQSEYHHAWYRFFVARTEGEVIHDAPNKTVIADLRVPIGSKVPHAVAAQGQISPHGNEEVSDDWDEGGQYASPSELIDEQLADCEDGNCVDWSSGDNFSGGNTYFVDGDLEEDDLVFETNGEEIDVIINGSYYSQGDTITINGDGEVTFHITNGVDIGGNARVNENGEARQFKMLVHSDAEEEITLAGNPIFVGVIYAPNVDITLSGAETFRGAIVGDDVTLNGVSASDIDYDPTLEDLELALSLDTDIIRYLHITDNKIDIRFD